MISDLNARVLRRLLFAKLGALESMVGITAGLRAWLWGIEVGKGARFIGAPVLFRTPESRISIGRDCTFRSSVTANFVGINRPCYIATLQAGASIRIGNNCGFSGTAIGAALSIEIGNNLKCGANTTITDTDWHHSDPARRREVADVPAARVVIEDDVWIGLGVTVLKGVRIGKGSVIGAGSVVTRDIPANVIAAGLPAKVLRSL